MRRSDKQQLDAIDRALDGEHFDLRMDPGEARTVSRLRALAGKSALNPGWSARVIPTNHALITFRPKKLQPPSIRFLRANSKFSVAASAGVILSIVLLSVLISLKSTDQSNRDDQASHLALGTPVVPPSCVYDERNQPFPQADFMSFPMITVKTTAVTAPLAPNAVVRAVSESDLHATHEPDQATQAAVLQALSERVGCRNSFAFGWGQVLVSGSIPRPPMVNDEIDGTPVSYFDQGDSSWMIPVPEILRMDQFSNLIVGVLLENDIYGYGLRQYDTYGGFNGVWHLIDTKLVATDSVLQNSIAKTPTSVELRIWYSWTDSFELQANAPVSIKITNNTNEAFIFRISELNVWEYLDPDKSAVVQLNSDAGEYLVEVLQPGGTVPRATSTLNLVPVDSAATPVS